MKLNLIFFMMDLLTILAYPIVFAYSKLHQDFKPKGSIHLPDEFIGDRSYRTGKMIEQKVMKVRRRGNYAYSNDLFSA